MQITRVYHKPQFDLEFFYHLQCYFIASRRFYWDPHAKMCLTPSRPDTLDNLPQPQAFSHKLASILFWD